MYLLGDRILSLFHLSKCEPICTDLRQFAIRRLASSFDYITPAANPQMPFNVRHLETTIASLEKERADLTIQLETITLTDVQIETISETDYRGWAKGGLCALVGEWRRGREFVH
jgi:hypothetical protein